MNWWTWRDVHGSLIERLEGRLLDVSASGCRLETGRALEVGSVGVIEIRDLNRPVAEAARVCGITERPGAAARFVLHLEFLPLALERRAPASVAVCNSDLAAADQVLPRSGERSDSNPTKGAVARQELAVVESESGQNRPENQQFEAIAQTAEALAAALNYSRPMVHGRMGRDYRCQREPSAFSGTTKFRADDL
jgi:hypothetical protein